MMAVGTEIGMHSTLISSTVVFRFIHSAQTPDSRDTQDTFTHPADQFVNYFIWGTITMKLQTALRYGFNLSHVLARNNDQVTKHRQAQLHSRWAAALRHLERDLGNLGTELIAADVDEEHGGSVPAMRSDTFK